MGKKSRRYQTTNWLQPTVICLFFRLMCGEIPECEDYEKHRNYQLQNYPITIKKAVQKSG